MALPLQISKPPCPAHCVTLQRAAVRQVLPHASSLYDNSHAATPWGSSAEQIQHKLLTAYEWELFQHGGANLRQRGVSVYSSAACTTLPTRSLQPLNLVDKTSH